MASVDQLLPVGAAPVADEKAKDPEKGMRALSVVGPPTEGQKSASLMDRIEAFLPGNTRMKKWITVGLVLAIALVASVLGWRMYASKSKGPCPDGYVEVEPSSGRRLMNDKNCVKDVKDSLKDVYKRSSLMNPEANLKVKADHSLLQVQRRPSDAQALMNRSRGSTLQTPSFKVQRRPSDAQAFNDMSNMQTLETPSFKVLTGPSKAQVRNRASAMSLNEVGNRMSTFGGSNEVGSRFSTPDFEKVSNRMSTFGSNEGSRRSSKAQVRRQSSNLQDRRQSSNLQELVGKYNDKRHGFTSTEAVVHKADETIQESVAYDRIRRMRQGYNQTVYDLKKDNQDLKKQKAFSDLTVYVQKATMRLSKGLEDSRLLGNIRDIEAKIADTTEKCSVTNSKLHNLFDKMQVKAYADELEGIETRNQQLAMKIEQTKADLNSKKGTLNTAFQSVKAQIHDLEGTGKPYDEVETSLSSVKTDYDNFVQKFESNFQLFWAELKTLIFQVEDLNSKQIAIDWSIRQMLKREDKAIAEMQASSQKD